jgi:hypothetical protein
MKVIFPFQITLFSCCSLLVMGTLLISQSHARSPRSRIRSTSTTTSTTTVAPSTSTERVSSNLSSATTLRSVPISTTTSSYNNSNSNSTSGRPNKRRRGGRVLRQRRLRARARNEALNKRQGQFAFDDENTSSQQEQVLYREPLYENQPQTVRPYRNPEEFDDYDKSPYYSPIKRQRNRGRPNYVTKQPQQLQPQQERQHLSAVYPTSASNLNPYSSLEPQHRDLEHHPDFPPQQQPVSIH